MMPWCCCCDGCGIANRMLHDVVRRRDTSASMMLYLFVKEVAAALCDPRF